MARIRPTPSAGPEHGLGVAFRESLGVLLRETGRGTDLPDRGAAADALQPGDAQPELLRAGRDRPGAANRHHVRHRDVPRARARARHAGAIDGQPALALGSDARQAHAVSVHLDGDGDVASVL